MARKTCWERSAAYGPRKGLTGPYFYPNGRVLYFDPKEQQYWDPTTDFYVDNHEVDALKLSLLLKLTPQNG